MLIKIGDKIYDPKKEIIAIFLQPGDRESIVRLPLDCNSILMAPPGTPVKEMEQFMAYVDVLLDGGTNPDDAIS